jgi:hypothetical protein
VSESLKRRVDRLEAEAGPEENAGELRLHVEHIEVEPDDPMLRPGGMYRRRNVGRESLTDLCVTVVKLRTAAPLELIAREAKEGPPTKH